MNMDPFVGEIRINAFNFAPRGWASCDGQIIPVAQNKALAALLGPTYGGDGVNTIGLPDLRGRMPLHRSPSTAFGKPGGQPVHALITQEIPAHNHSITASSAPGNRSTGANNFLAAARGHYAPSADQALTSGIAPAGGSEPHNNMPPYLALTFVIAMTGIYPSRS